MSIEIKDDTMALETGNAPEADIPTNITINQKVGDRTCASYNFKGEDHTLGNLLRYALVKNPDCELAGYSITHPSESEMNLRLQTTGKGTNRVMKKGFKVIKKLLEIAENKFNAELERFEAAQA